MLILYVFAFLQNAAPAKNAFSKSPLNTPVISLFLLMVTLTIKSTPAFFAISVDSSWNGLPKSMAFEAFGDSKILGP